MVIGGAWNNDGRAKNAGHARAFRLDGDEWKQVGQTLEGESEEDHFGWYVSMSDDGKTIAASAFSGDVDGNAEAGYVRVFALDDSGDKWVQLGDDLTGEKQFEQFGRAMAMSKDGRRLAVGSTRWNQETGIVRVFDFDYGKWSQVGRDLTGLAPGDWFGSGVALNADGNVIAIGADGVETGGNKAGLIRAFLLEGCCTWKQYGQDIVGPGDQGRLGMHQVRWRNVGFLFRVIYSDILSPRTLYRLRCLMMDAVSSQVQATSITTLVKATCIRSVTTSGSRLWN